jgi:hypothetical protein
MYRLNRHLSICHSLSPILPFVAQVVIHFTNVLSRYGLLDLALSLIVITYSRHRMTSLTIGCRVRQSESPRSLTSIHLSFMVDHLRQQDAPPASSLDQSFLLALLPSRSNLQMPRFDQKTRNLAQAPAHFIWFGQHTHLQLIPIDFISRLI